MAEAASRLRTPVALLIFNRPEMTRRVAERIAAARPPRVLVFGDGPRADHPTDGDRVRQTQAVIDRIDWPCDVVTNYSATNLGTKYRPATGLDWVFDQVEEAIFLEDDCLPHPSFFRFCDELLERYRHDERVMMVSGDNFMPNPPITPYSYLFNTWVGIWGWATWRRAWQHYDVDLRSWEALRETSFLSERLPNPGVRQLWHDYFDRIVSGATLTWDHQWQFACLRRGGLSAVPQTNLVSNVGFGPDAAHYVTVDPLLSDLPVTEMRFPLQHPASIMANREYDGFVERELFLVPESGGR
jgi:hypothetical protein